MAAKKSTNPPKKGVQVNLSPSNEIESRRLYANLVQVTQSPYDFTLRFCDVTPIFDAEEVLKNEGVHDVPIVAEIAIPFDVMPNLIKALQNQNKIRKAAIRENEGGKKKN